MVGEAMRTDWCVYDRWVQNMRSDEKRWGVRRWEPIVVSIAGGPICVTSASIASEIEEISTPNQKGGNSFFVVLFLMKGKTVNV
jgi:hypothetical protein